MDRKLTEASTTAKTAKDNMVAQRQSKNIPYTDSMASVSDEEGPFSSPGPKYEEPLYTEINIPLPPLPKPKANSSVTGKRQKSQTISSFHPFHRRGSSSDTANKSVEDWPRIKKEVKSREVAAAMSLTSRHKRSGTVDALAVIPAILVLSAELFTPSDGTKKKDRSGKWEDGMI